MFWTCRELAAELPHVQNQQYLQPSLSPPLPSYPRGAWPCAAPASPVSPEIKGPGTGYFTPRTGRLRKCNAGKRGKRSPQTPEDSPCRGLLRPVDCAFMPLQGARRPATIFLVQSCNSTCCPMPTGCAQCFCEPSSLSCGPLPWA